MRIPTFIRPLVLLGPLLALTAFSGVSYTKLTDPTVERAFYAACGKHHLGDRVHLHVTANTLLAGPDEEVRTPRGGKLALYRNKTVPLVVDPGSVYLRKILQRSDSGDHVCVKGDVRKDPSAGGERCAVFVHTLKKAPPPAKKKPARKKPKR